MRVSRLEALRSVIFGYRLITELIDGVWHLEITVECCLGNAQGLANLIDPDGLVPVQFFGQNNTGRIWR